MGRYQSSKELLDKQPHLGRNASICSNLA